MKKSQVPRYMRAVNAQQAEEFRRQTAAGEYDLDADEAWWRDRSQILEDHGYQLRSRLRPGWVPSWQDSDKNPLFCEDSTGRCTRKVVDAVRQSDERDVAVMNISRDSDEREILDYVMEAQRSSGDDNHIAPILETFEDDREPELKFYVMPLLRKFDKPPFVAVSEILELFRQLLEALIFLHSIHVTHRDCSLGNIMMDAPSIFPRGFHPTNIATDRGGVFSITTIPRYKATGPIRYYLIDFGISRIYEPDEEHLYIGDDGADRDIPELSDDVAYDPFRADVFILGNILKKHFIPMYKNLDFLSPLANAMTAANPLDRPTAVEAQKQFNSIVRSQSFVSLRRRLVRKDEVKNRKSVIYEDVGILLDAALYPVRVVIGFPSQTIGALRGLIKPKSSKGKTA
ncbi:hypothetical protein SCHPADRAFT_852018 [Schizopora paradoxa]|uniref:Protein kinase domain-containing protein n=1 Tax=Schizopora paradoxa TaxID=27342 RepID=A0A0H2RWN7_9AGAM|nr:hypothetical protein SCHPADRAFT_852018 [Schizopora paradoxa]